VEEGKTINDSLWELEVEAKGSFGSLKSWGKTPLLRNFAIAFQWWVFA